MAYFSRDPEGYKKLLTWQNAVTIRDIVQKLTAAFEPYKYRRLIDHMVDSGRSMQRNIEEGFKRTSTKEYISFLGFSRASLEELKGDTDDCFKRYGLISESEWDNLKTRICQNDCLLGRQIRSLEAKMDREHTRPQGERVRWIKQREKEAEKRFWKKVGEMGLERLENGKFRMRENEGR